MCYTARSSIAPEEKKSVCRFWRKSFRQVKALACSLACHSIQESVSNVRSCECNRTIGVGRYTCVIPEALGAGAMGSRHFEVLLYYLFLHESTSLFSALVSALAITKLFQWATHIINWLTD